MQSRLSYTGLEQNNCFLLESAHWRCFLKAIGLCVNINAVGLSLVINSCV